MSDGSDATDALARQSISGGGEINRFRSLCAEYMYAYVDKFDVSDK